MDAPAAAAIIAGGRARRFGGLDKSRLVVEGRSIIDRQLEILQQITDRVFIVSSDAVRFADLGVPVFPDLIDGAGALGGIYTALEASSRDFVLTVACDLPFLHAGLLNRLVECTAGHDAAWIRTARGPEPLLACYHRGGRGTVRREIEAGRLKASDLGALLDVVELHRADVECFGPPDRLLTNINTPDDLSQLGPA